MPRERVTDAELGLDEDEVEDVVEDDVEEDDQQEEPAPKGKKKDSTGIDADIEAQIDKDLADEAARTQKGAPKKAEDTRQRTTAAPRTRTSGADHGGAQFLQQFARTHLSQDKTGNLVNPSTGEVVAAAGRERFYFEQARSSRNSADKLTRGLREAITLGRELETKVTAYEKVNQSGLSMQDQTQAVTLYKSWKANPAATLKYILTEAQANGIDLSGVLGKDASALDMGAIGSLIDNKLKPFTDGARQAKEQQTQQRQFEEQAAQQTQQFFDDFPDAAIHEDVLANIIRQNPQVRPEKAYVELKAFAEKYDLDWSQPLGPQMKAKRDGTNTTRRPLPSGRAQRQIEDDANREPASMGATARTDDIVRQAMREAGMNI